MISRTRLSTAVVGWGGAWLLMSACGGCSPITVGSAWAPQTASMGQLGPTFAWIKGTSPPTGKSELDNPQLHNLIRAIVERQLAAKGYVKRSSDPVDFWVGYRVTRTVGGDPSSAVPFEEYTEGTLGLYVINPTTGRWLWRAWAQARLNESNPPEVKKERLEQSVSMMLKDFPSRKEPPRKGKP